MTNPYQELANYIKEAENIVIFTGAGISTESGIPDFRSNDGIYKENNNAEYYVSNYFYQKEPKEFWKKFKKIFQIKLMGDYKPNAGHDFIAELEKAGKTVTVLTQNVDGLHQKAGSTNVIQLHGTLQTATCPKCKTQYDLEFINAHDIPRCTKTNAKENICNFILKPDVVLFGGSIQGYNKAEDVIDESTLFICMGTSLEVYPVNNLPQYAKYDWKTKLAIINKEATKKDELFHVVIHEKIGEAVHEIKKYL